MPTDSSDNILLFDNDPAPIQGSALQPWKILVIDDDDQVHAVTRLVLRYAQYRNRPMQLICVKSAREARETLQKETDLALALVDVVMETNTAGLDLVRHIRDELKNRSIRLILHTGQPGHAPEQDVVLSYEIDAYLSKTDVSAQRLVTAITSSLRAYEYISEIQKFSQDLESQVTQRTGQLRDSNRDLQRANAELAHGADTLRQLGEVGREITANLELQAVFESLRRHVGALLEAQFFGVFKINANGTSLEMACGVEDGNSLQPSIIPLNARGSGVAQAARERREVLVNIGKDDGAAYTVQGTRRMASMLFAPLISNQRMLGVMSVQSDRPNAYGERERMIFSTLCAYTAIAIDNAQAYRQLKEAQAKLVAQEKLAALGSLVAGVAHELNTPLGNSMVMAGSLHDSIAEMDRKLNSPNMQRAELQTFLNDAKEASEVIMRCVSSAVDLVSSFKQVAVDRTTAQRRRFDLQQTSHEIIATMMNQIKVSGHEVTLDIPPGFLMNSYPGPYGQVLTNFISNAMLHAFEKREGGRMVLSARQETMGRVLIQFQDDGNGIKPQDLPRIFDPFFSTKMGQGGSGLGMSISYNIVTSLLNGQISVMSEPGKGTTFLLDLPLSAPELPPQ